MGSQPESVYSLPDLSCGAVGDAGRLGRRSCWGWEWDRFTEGGGKETGTSLYPGTGAAVGSLPSGSKEAALPGVRVL